VNRIEELHERLNEVLRELSEIDREEDLLDPLLEEGMAWQDHDSRVTNFSFHQVARALKSAGESVRFVLAETSSREERLSFRVEVLESMLPIMQLLLHRSRELVAESHGQAAVDAIKVVELPDVPDLLKP